MLSKPFIKICGITILEDAEFAISAGVDAVGFIAYPRSPRYISADIVKNICNRLTTTNIKKVGVFVDASINTVDEYIAAGINTIQLHGNETANFAKKCKKRAEVWKALKPEFCADILEYVEYPADKFLLDAFHRELAGGTGLTVDKELAKFAIEKLSVPVILAGGINPANIATIFNDVTPYGLDINSGVEKTPGIKNHKLIKKIFEALEKAG